MHKDGDVNTSDIHSLQERAKELRCLYQVQEAVSDRSLPLPSVFLRIVEAIPDGWQFPKLTGACIEYLGRNYVGPGYSHSGPHISAPILLGEKKLGEIKVVLASESVPDKQIEIPFLPEEQQLLNTIAKRLSEYLEWKHTQMLGERVAGPIDHWRWREAYAEALSMRLDWDRFGVTRLFIGGSTENGQAGPGSDIDLFVEFHGTAHQRQELQAWIEGWGTCLSEVVHRKTGYWISESLIDLHWFDASTDPRTLHEYRELSKPKSKK